MVNVSSTHLPLAICCERLCLCLAFYYSYASRIVLDFMNKKNKKSDMQVVMSGKEKICFVKIDKLAHFFQNYSFCLMGMFVNEVPRVDIENILTRLGGQVLFLISFQNTGHRSRLRKNTLHHYATNDKKPARCFAPYSLDIYRNILDFTFFKHRN
jgi:hypothetical protein